MAHAAPVGVIGKSREATVVFPSREHTVRGVRPCFEATFPHAPARPGHPPGRGVGTDRPVRLAGARPGILAWLHLVAWSPQYSSAGHYGRSHGAGAEDLAAGGAVCRPSAGEAIRAAYVARRAPRRAAALRPRRRLSSIRRSPAATRACWSRRGSCSSRRSPPGARVVARRISGSSRRASGRSPAPPRAAAPPWLSGYLLEALWQPVARHDIPLSVRCSASSTRRS